MRNCPVCASEERTDLGLYQEGWSLFECACGMRYLDAPDASQDALNVYYANDTSPDLHGEDSIARLAALAEIIQKIGGRGVDIGGKYCHELREAVPGLEAVGVAEPLDGTYDYAVISHTLEHVYDVDGLLSLIVDHLRPGGKVVVEVPIWADYTMIGYDFHWQHLNKFTPRALARLFKRFGFSVTGGHLPKFQEYFCYRLVGVKA